MLLADANDILTIVCDFGVRADGTVTQWILRTILDRLDDAARGMEQSAQGADIGEARAVIGYQPTKSHFHPGQIVATDTLNVHF